ncbi:MAG TPA: ABC transporter ATP-binding protein [Firmicutes bacterium]|nr:ABC transporter ATP-binding protein [Candidatus Fermentithermobacillaceae bacterium]
MGGGVPVSLIEVRGLRKEYGKVVAVGGVDFRVDKGEIFGLLGPNGAGKSTTISMIAGLVTPTAGSIFLHGKDVTKAPHRMKEVLGLVPQDIALYPSLTARENLFFWGRMYSLPGPLLRERVEEALEYAGLKDRANDRIDTYSGGMKRRINIAAALLHRPELLIMDEPTVGIDPQSRSHILETVQRLNREDVTVLYTSHYMEEVEYLCSRIAIMDHGAIIAEGTLEELRSTVGDTDSVELTLSDAPGSLAEEIAGLPGVLQAKKVDSTITTLVKDGHERVAAILETVYRAGVKVRSIQIVEPNLESVFLKLTGRALRD